MHVEQRLCLEPASMSRCLIHYLFLERVHKWSRLSSSTIIHVFGHIFVVQSINQPCSPLNRKTRFRPCAGSRHVIFLPGIGCSYVWKRGKLTCIQPSVRVYVRVRVRPSVCVCECACVFVRVCVWEWEREGERERESMCAYICVCVRVCVCVCVCLLAYHDPKLQEDKDRICIGIHWDQIIY